MPPQKRRPQKDNIIYANFGANRQITDSDDAAAVIQLAGRSHSSAAGWLAKVVDTRAELKRASRGLAYYRTGHVLNFSTAGGKIAADVVGSQNDPFRVSIGFPPRSTQDFQQAVELVARNPQQLGQIREGKLADKLLHTLLAESGDELRLFCDCPDPFDCCKHIIAVLHHAIVAFDNDPNLVFALRGLTLGEFEQKALELSKPVSDKKASESSEHFWSGGTLPNLPNPKTQSALDDSDLQLLHKAIRMISFGSIDELRGVADVEDLYDALTRSGGI